MQGSKRNTDVKNRLLDYVGEGEGGMIWENSIETCIFSSVQFSHSVMSNSLQPHALQHSRPPCPSPTPRAYSNSCPLSRWCHPTASPSVIPFSSCLQSFPSIRVVSNESALTSAGQVLELKLQHQSFQWIFRVDFLWIDWFGQSRILEWASYPELVFPALQVDYLPAELCISHGVGKTTLSRGF